MGKTQTNFRLSDELRDWLTAYSEATGDSKTYIVEQALRAVQRGEIMFPSQNPNPFPASQTLAGEVPEFPLFIAYSDQREDP